MGIGAGILLMALGAILTFAVDWKVAGVDMHVIGWILMGAGALGLILFFAFWNRRRTPAVDRGQPQGPDQPMP
jgi:Na+/proline symporter